MAFINKEDILEFETELKNNEKSNATVSKYSTAVTKLSVWLGDEILTKQKLLEYRDYLLENYKAQTVNGHLSAINAYLEFRKIENVKIHFVRVQRQAFVEENRELSQAEYKELLSAALSNGNQRLYLLMMTLGSTGIRVSELEYITVQAVKEGRAQIYMKGKCRTILLPKQLCVKLKAYIKKRNITAGIVFRTESGKVMDRANICHEMKKLCSVAKVDKRKVFPHNFRHLFARSFFAIEKNLAHLADVLGHSRIETTRIYVAVSVSEHQRTLSKMKLVE